MIILDKENFEGIVLNTDALVLVDYCSEACDPCKILTEDVKELATVYKDRLIFSTLNVAKSRRVAVSQEVLGLPTVSIYKNGEKLDELSNELTSKVHIEAMIKRALRKSG